MKEKARGQQYPKPYEEDRLSQSGANSCPFSVVYTSRPSLTYKSNSFVEVNSCDRSIKLVESYSLISFEQ